MPTVGTHAIATSPGSALFLDLVGLAQLAENRPVQCIVQRRDGSKERLELVHSYSETQLDWFRAGSALNALGRRAAGAGLEMAEKGVGRG